MFSLLDLRREGLRVRYAEPYRAYHNQAHIDALLQGLRELDSAVTDPVAMELAIWYHDAIYNPAANDNETRSAALLRAEMAGLADSELITKAELMVQLTAGHTIPPEVPEAWWSDCAYFLDLDLAVLGAAPAVFDFYEQGIAAEYQPVYGAESYRAGRTTFLRKLLDRPRLFHTDRFHTALDAPSRANLRRALAKLA